jgi:hypothetical protein
MAPDRHAPDARREPAGPSHEDLRFVAFLDSLVSAVLSRSARAIHALLAEPLARGLPREVREEALVAARAANSMRAPVRLLWFHHQMLQLHANETDARGGSNEPEDESRWFDDEEDARDRAGASDSDAQRSADRDQIDLFGRRIGREE